MKQSILKGITYIVLNIIIAIMCGLWLVYGMEGVGNIYIAWISFVLFVMTFAFVVILCSTAPLKDMPKARWWVRLNSKLCLLAQLGLLIWYGHGWYALMMIVACVEVFIIEGVLKSEEKDCATS